MPSIGCPERDIAARSRGIVVMVVGVVALFVAWLAVMARRRGGGEWRMPGRRRAICKLRRS